MKYEETVMKTSLEAVWDFEKFKLDQAEVSFKAGVYEMIETYKSHNPESYKKHKTWWDCIGGIITDREPS